VQKFAAFSCNACKPDGGIFAEKFFASAATRANPARKLYVQNLCPRTPPLRPEWAPNVLRHKGAHFMVGRGKIFRTAPHQRRCWQKFLQNGLSAKVICDVSVLAAAYYKIFGKQQGKDV